MTQTIKGIKRWVLLGFGTIIMLILGLIYAWSVFETPLRNAHGWEKGETSLTFTLSIIFFVLGLIATGFLSKKIPPRILMVVAGALLAMGFLICSFFLSLPTLYLGYGVLVGLGVGIANNALVSSVTRWFPDKRGLASGILMMGFGLGGFLLSGSTHRFIEAWGVEKVFLLFAIVFGVVVALGFFVALPPSKEVVDYQSSNAQGSTITQGMAPKQVLGTVSCWMFLLWFTLVMAGGLLIIGNASPFAIAVGMAKGQAAFATGILSLANGIGRLLTGVTVDKLGLPRGMRLMTTYLLLAGGVLLVSYNAANVVLLFVGFVLTGLSYGGGPTVSSLYAMEKYGQEHFSMNYAILSAGMIPSALLGPLLAGYLLDTTGSYAGPLVVILVFSVIAQALLFIPGFAAPARKKA